MVGTQRTNVKKNVKNKRVTPRWLIEVDGQSVPPSTIVERKTKKKIDVLTRAEKKNKTHTKKEDTTRTYRYVLYNTLVENTPSFWFVLLGRT